MDIVNKEDYFFCILENLPEAIVVTDVKGNIKFLNKSAKILINYDEKDLIDTPIVNLYSDDEKNKMLHIWSATIRYNEVNRVDTEILDKYGNSISVGISLSLLKDNEQKIVGVVQVIRDLKDMKKLQEQLIRSEKLSALGELGAGIAHELNNPLGGVLGYTQLLLHNLERGKISNEDVENYKKYLTIIESETKRCQEIIQNLINLSKRARDDFRLVNVNSVIESIIFDFQSKPEFQNIKVTKNLYPHLPMIAGNSSYLAHVFLSIILNAQQAMPDGGDLIITTRMKVKQDSSFSLNDEDFIEILFTDTGCGIPDENKGKIFEPFFTTKKATKGTGLGLSACYSIIKNHNGTIDVESKVGEGSTFIISLPVSHFGKDHISDEYAPLMRSMKW